jgi:hypothetical protein
MACSFCARRIDDSRKSSGLSHAYPDCHSIGVLGNLFSDRAVAVILSPTRDSTPGLIAGVTAHTVQQYESGYVREMDGRLNAQFF